MITHHIILSSSYSTGKRIGLDFVSDLEAFQKAIEIVGGAYDGKFVGASIHSIVSDDETWKSVVEKDSYFKDVMLLNTPEEMVTLIQKDRYLSGIDVARYILSKKPCTHTRLQKLTYMCYADYLVSTGDRLFLDTIEPFQHGPVIKSVYARFASLSSEKPGVCIDKKEIRSEDEELPIKSMLLFSEDGNKKVFSIDATLAKFEKTPTEVLIDLTHRKGTPWSIAIETSSPTITDEYIKMGHTIESS